MSIKNNIIELQNKLNQASCKLIAVSKTQPESAIMEAYDAGQRIFGENRTQELINKEKILPEDIQWHMIGHLQRNKVKHIVPFVDMIHSVDSWRLLAEINKQGQKINRVINCLLQIYIAKEESKHGFDPQEVIELITGEDLPKLKFVAIRGLMGMGTFSEDHELIRTEFKNLKSLFDKINALELPPNVIMDELSMGMTNDYTIAIEEGSSMVRVGTAIFGERIKNE